MPPAVRRVNMMLFVLGLTGPERFVLRLASALMLVALCLFIWGASWLLEMGRDTKETQQRAQALVQRTMEQQQHLRPK